MSDLENKNQEAAPKKRPYNLREKKEKNIEYRCCTEEVQRSRLLG